MASPHGLVLRGRNFIKVNVGRLQHEFSAMLHGVPCIHDKIEDDLLDLCTIGANGAQVRGKDGTHFNVFTDDAAQHLFKIVNQGVEIEDFGLQNLAAAEGQKLARQGSGAVGSVINAFQATAKFLGGTTIQQQTAVATDDRQQIAEVVCDAAGQPADGFHLLRLPQLMARLFQLERSFRDLLFQVLLILTKELLDAFAAKNLRLQIQLNAVLSLLSNQQAKTGAEEGDADDEQGRKSAFPSDVKR